MQRMTRDGLTLENQTTGDVENVSEHETEQNLSPQQPPQPFHDAVTTPLAPELQWYIRKAEKAADRLDAAQAKIPKKKVLSPERTVDAMTGKKTMRLRFEEIDKVRPPSKLTHIVTDIPVLEAHRQISKVEDENVGVQAAHKSEQTAGTGVRAVNSIHRSQKLKPYRAAALEKKADQANVNALYQKALRDSHELHSNLLSRWQQKQAIKRQYAAAKKARQTAQTTKKTAERPQKRQERQPKLRKDVSVCRAQLEVHPDHPGHRHGGHSPGERLFLLLHAHAGQYESGDQ